MTVYSDSRGPSGTSDPGKDVIKCLQETNADFKVAASRTNFKCFVFVFAFVFIMAKNSVADLGFLSGVSGASPHPDRRSGIVAVETSKRQMAVFRRNGFDEEKALQYIADVAKAKFVHADPEKDAALLEEITAELDKFWLKPGNAENFVNDAVEDKKIDFPEGKTLDDITATERAFRREQIFARAELESARVAAETDKDDTLSEPKEFGGTRPKSGAFRIDRGRSRKSREGGRRRSRSRSHSRSRSKSRRSRHRSHRSSRRRSRSRSSRRRRSRRSRSRSSSSSSSSRSRSRDRRRKREDKTKSRPHPFGILIDAVNEEGTPRQPSSKDPVISEGTFPYHAVFLCLLGD